MDFSDENEVYRWRRANSDDTRVDGWLDRDVMVVSDGVAVGDGVGREDCGKCSCEEAKCSMPCVSVVCVSV